MERAIDIPPKIEDLLGEAGWLRQLAASLVGPARADDLVQDTWLAALRRPPRADGEPRPWLARVVRNLARNERRGRARREARERFADEERASASPEALAQAAEAQRLLAESVTRLTEPLRAVIVLCYFQGLDSSAAAKRLGLPASTVRTRLQTALAELRADLDRRCKGGRNAWALLLAPLAHEARVGTTGAAAVTASAPFVAWSALLGAGVLGVLALGAWRWNAARVEDEGEAALAAVASATESAPAKPALSTSGDAREPVTGPASTPDTRGASGQPPADFQSEVSGTVLVDGRPPQWPIELTLEPELPPAEPSGRRLRMPRPVLTLAPEQRGAFVFRRLPADWRGRLVVADFLLAGGETSVSIDGPASGLVLELRSAPEIVGRILAPDGLAIPGLEGTYEFSIGPTGMPANEINTRGFACRDDGHFRISSKTHGEWGRLTLTVEAGQGYLRHDTPSFVPPEGLDLGELMLERAHPLEFTVRDALGVPLAGAIARVEAPPFARPSLPTDAEGRGVLAWMPERTADVRFGAFAHADRVLTIEPGSELDVELGPLAMLTVKLHASVTHMRLSAESSAFVWDPGEWDASAVFQGERGAALASVRRRPVVPGQRWEYEFDCAGAPLALVGLRPGVALTLEARDADGRTLAVDTIAVETGARAVLELGGANPAGDSAPAQVGRRKSRESSK